MLSIISSRKQQGIKQHKQLSTTTNFVTTAFPSTTQHTIYHSTPRAICIQTSQANRTCSTYTPRLLASQSASAVGSAMSSAAARLLTPMRSSGASRPHQTDMPASPTLPMLAMLPPLLLLPSASSTSSTAEKAEGVAAASPLLLAPAPACRRTCKACRGEDGSLGLGAC